MSRIGHNLVYNTAGEPFLGPIVIEAAVQSTFTAALEAGGTTFLFQPTHEALAAQWQKLAKFRAIHVGRPGTENESSEARPLT